MLRCRNLHLVALAAILLPACGEQRVAEPSPPAGTEVVLQPALSQIPGIADRAGVAPLEQLFAVTDPSADAAWRSEQLGDAIGKQLKALAAAFSEATPMTDVLADGARANALRPALETYYDDARLTVSRAGQVDADPGFDVGTQLAALRSVYAADGEVRMKFKLTGVVLPDEAEPLAKSEAVLEIVGDGAIAGQRINHSARWNCQWSLEDPAHPKLVELRASGFEEVVAKGALFVDATAGILGDQESFTGQLAHGADYWYGNLDVSFGIHQGNQGLAIGDANGDGREDLFVCQPAGLPSRLFLREADGSLRDATYSAGFDWLDTARSALFVDLDNDGDQDLVVTLGYSLVVFENGGDAAFERTVSIDIHSWPASISAVDYDLDGDLDLYACGYNPRGETAPGDIFANPVPYHDANNGARNFLIENLGALDFVDVTKAVGLGDKNRRFSFAASWEDYDNDGDPDLYVANDFGRNNLYRNDPGQNGKRQFREVAAAAGVEDIAAGMSVSWGDFDRDGWPDLYTSNMFSAAGNRVVVQETFKPGVDGAIRDDILRHARGNTLYRNRRDGTFEDVSESMGVTLGRWAWGSRFVDLNNDGSEDIVVANGFFSTPASGDL